MASSNFNPLQQRHLSLNTPCKYQSTLSFKSHSFISHITTISNLYRHSLHQQLSSVFVQRLTVIRGNLNASISPREHKNSSKTDVPPAQRESGSGFPSLSACFERVEKKSKGSSVVEEKKETNPRKNSYVKRHVKYRGKVEMGSSAFSPLRPRCERVVSETKVRPIVDEKMKKVFERSEGRSRQVREGNKNKISESKVASKEGKMDKSPKKNKADSLRLLLDMCSKRGDVMGAISLYELARREGIKLGQHHYTVLLYLCSSAAVGVVRPAKSGSGNRSIDKVDLTNEISNASSVDLSKNLNTDNAWFNVKTPLPALSGEKSVIYNNLHGLASTKLDSSGGASQLETVEKGEKSVYNQIEQFNKLPGGVRNEEQINSNQHPVDINPEDDSAKGRQGSINQEDSTIQVSEEVKRYALMRGFEIYESMRSENVPLNEAALTSVARMAMSMGDGNMAFDMVKQMKALDIKPRLRSYGPALFTFCSNGDLEKAFIVEEHMLENGVYPEEPELEALLRLSVEVGSGEKVYYLLHKLRTSIRKVSSSTAYLIERWFRSKAASRVGKNKLDQRFIMEAMENGGGGWHGKGWLGRGKWTIIRTTVGSDGVCEGCGEKLVTIDLDPTETENFAKSVASIAAQREKNSSFQKFQEWLDYYGPFEAVVDAANVGLFNQRRFVLSKVNAIINAIRQKLPSKKWPLIIVHNKRITGRKMNEPANKMLLEKWKTAEALYLTPTGSNDDWYWLYAAIKFKCFIVTNDEMRDHVFQLLGNNFFPRWKERHQVRFSFREGGPELYMPPPCSVVIQESERGYWHIPIVSEHDSERERTWLCATRANRKKQDSKEVHCYNSEEHVRVNNQARSKMKLPPSGNGNGGKIHQNIEHHKKLYQNLRTIISNSVFSNLQTLISDIESAEELGGCIIDFQI